MKSPNPNIVAMVSLLVAITSVVLSGVLFFSEGKGSSVGIIRIDKIMTEYPGAQEARLEFQKKIAALQSNVDTLRSELQTMILVYERERSSLNAAQKAAREQDLLGKESQVRSYEEAVMQKVKDENSMLTQGIVNQVRTATESVGTSLDFDMILALQDNGMLLYGTEATDVTDNVLAVLKSRYNGQRH